MTFIWGDGERETGSTPDACHRFRYPGELLVSVVVEASDSQPVWAGFSSPTPWFPLPSWSSNGRSRPSHS